MFNVSMLVYKFMNYNCFFVKILYLYIDFGFNNFVLCIDYFLLLFIYGLFRGISR